MRAISFRSVSKAYPSQRPSNKPFLALIGSRLVVNQAALKLKRAPIRRIIDAFDLAARPRSVAQA